VVRCLLHRSKDKLLTISQSNPDHEFKPCIWCGIPVSLGLIKKRVERKAVNPEACRDCRDDRIEIMRNKSWTHKTLGIIVCNPWSGDLDDFWRPITDDGDLYRPGERVCGLKDCVKFTHVIPAPVKTVSDTDMILMMHEMQQHNRRTKVQ
jgi:hypothetical protein